MSGSCALVLVAIRAGCDHAEADQLVMEVQLPDTTQHQLVGVDMGLSPPVRTTDEAFHRETEQEDSVTRQRASKQRNITKRANN